MRGRLLFADGIKLKGILSALCSPYNNYEHSVWSGQNTHRSSLSSDFDWWAGKNSSTEPKDELIIQTCSSNSLTLCKLNNATLPHYRALCSLRLCTVCDHSPHYLFATLSLEDSCDHTRTGLFDLTRLTLSSRSVEIYMDHNLHYITHY